MVDTAQTLAANLVAAADGGPARNFTLQKIRNVLLSYPPYDTISGSVAPSILRGTYDGADYFVKNGGAIGDMSGTPSQRATNGTVLNALFTAAASNGKMVELPPNTYEINNSTGLVIPPGAGFVFRGGRNGTIIRQFYVAGSGAPILTIGDGTGSVLSTGMDIQGFKLLYGAAQTGLTASRALVINNSAWSKFGNAYIGEASGNPPYENIAIATNTVFSCSFADFACNQAQQHQLHITASGTGNVYHNMYFNQGGSNTYNALAGNYIFFDAGVVNEMTFIQTNLEWGACNQPLNVQNCIGLRFIDLHIEGIKFTGFNPTVFFTSNSAITIDTLDLVDVVIQAANFTGKSSMITDYNAMSSTVQVNSLTWVNNTAGLVTAPTLVFEPTSDANGDDQPTIAVNKGFLRDGSGTNPFPANFQFDLHMPITSSQFRGPSKFMNYEYGPGGSNVRGAAINISATYNHYGQYSGAHIFVPASITSFTITLKATMGATGNQAVPAGQWVHIRRQSGSASGTLTVADDAASTLTTNTTSAQDFFYQMSASTGHFVAFTPVT